METVRNLYLADSIPWVIGYSGGKDSTATLQLVWLALRELPDYQLKKPVHIINTDTLVESPVVAKWAQQSLLHITPVGLMTPLMLTFLLFLSMTV